MKEKINIINFDFVCDGHYMKIIQSIDGGIKARVRGQEYFNGLKITMPKNNHA